MFRKIISKSTHPYPSQEGNKPVEIQGFIPLLRGARGVYLFF
jgi:hypothetical protein